MAVTGEPTQVPFTGSPIQVWSGTGEAIDILMFNQDQNNTVTVNYRNDVQVGASNAVPIGPQSSVTMDGSRTLYANAPNGTAAMIVIPGGGNFFQRLVSLTIPTGATTGARVVINGATGTITGYNAANQVVYVLSPTSFIVGPSTGTQIELTESGTNGLLEFLFNTASLINGYIEGQLGVGGLGSIVEQGPQSTVAGYTDSVQTVMGSAEPTALLPAFYALFYIDALGVSHDYFEVSDYGAAINGAIVTGIVPGTGTTPSNPAVAETWHNIPLAAGWTIVAGYTAQYRMNALGNVELSGRITCSSASLIISTALPNGYYATGVTGMTAAVTATVDATAIAGQTIRIALSNAGILSIAGVTTVAGVVISLDGVMFPVSAG
jgi:hypothetical protein